MQFPSAYERYSVKNTSGNDVDENIKGESLCSNFMLLPPFLYSEFCQIISLILEIYNTETEFWELVVTVEKSYVIFVQKTIKNN